MIHLIDKDALVAEIERRIKAQNKDRDFNYLQIKELESLLSFLNTLEVKDVDLMIHTIIAECCDWLAVHTDLSHDKIEGCRNLMLTIKDEQLKAQKDKV